MLAACQPSNLSLNLFTAKIYHQRTALKSMGVKRLICPVIPEGVNRAPRFISEMWTSKLLEQAFTHVPTLGTGEWEVKLKSIITNNGWLTALKDGILMPTAFRFELFRYFKVLFRW